MVVSYDILTVIQVVLSIATVVYLCTVKDKKFSNIVILILALCICLIDAAQLPMSVLLNQFIGFNIASIVIWFSVAIRTIFYIARGND